MDSYKITRKGISFVYLKETNYYERGFCHGKLLKEEINTLVNGVDKFSRKKFGVFGSKVVKSYLFLRAKRLVNNFPQDLREEIEGISKGSGLDVKWILLANSIYEIVAFLPFYKFLFACSSFLTKNNKGEFLVAKTTDLVNSRDLTKLFTKLRTVFVYNSRSGNYLTLTTPGVLAGDVLIRDNGLGVFVNDGGFPFVKYKANTSNYVIAYLRRLAQTDSYEGLMNVIKNGSVRKPLVITVTDGTDGGSFLAEVYGRDSHIQTYRGSPLINTNFIMNKRLRAIVYKKQFVEVKAASKLRQVKGSFIRRRRIVDNIGKTTSCKKAVSILRQHGPKFNFIDEGSISNMETVQGIVYLYNNSFYLPAGDKVPITYSGAWKKYNLSDVFA